MVQRQHLAAKFGLESVFDLFSVSLSNLEGEVREVLLGYSIVKRLVALVWYVLGLMEAIKESYDIF